MSVPKEKLHQLIDQLPDNKTDQVAIIIENFLEKSRYKDLRKIYLNPIKINGKFVIPSREEKNER